MKAVADNLLTERLEDGVTNLMALAVWRAEAKESGFAMQLLQQVSELLHLTA